MFGGCRDGTSAPVASTIGADNTLTAAKSAIRRPKIRSTRLAISRPPWSSSDVHSSVGTTPVGFNVVILTGIPQSCQSDDQGTTQILGLVAQSRQLKALSSCAHRHGAPMRPSPEIPQAVWRPGCTKDRREMVTTTAAAAESGVIARGIEPIDGFPTRRPGCWRLRPIQSPFSRTAIVGASWSSQPASMASKEPASQRVSPPPTRPSASRSMRLLSSD